MWRRGSVQGQTCSKRVWDIPLDLTVSNACQPRIRPLHAASDWQSARGRDYTLEWQKLNKGNAWREAEGTHRDENQFIPLSVRGRAGRQDRDTAREKENGHRGEIKVEKDRYKDKCDWLRHCKQARFARSRSVITVTLIQEWGCFRFDHEVWAAVKTIRSGAITAFIYIIISKSVITDSF